MSQPANTKHIPSLRFPEFSGKWVSKLLGDVASFSKGKGIAKNEIDEFGSIECIRYGELYTHYGEVITEVKSKTNINISDLVLSTPNDVIIPASGETQLDIATAACVMRGGIALGGDLNIIRTEFFGVFLAYYLNSVKKREIAKLAQGNSVVHLYSSQLKTLLITTPTLPEQTKIAAFLSAVDTKIDQLSQKKALLEQYKKGVMQQIFSQQIRFKTDDGCDYPEWEEKKLGEVGTLVGGGTPETSNEDYWNGSIQWFTPTEIKQDFVSESLRTITEAGLKKSSAKLLPVGTILVTTRATIGEVAITLRECATNQGFQSIVVQGHNNIYIMNWLKFNKHLLIKKANGSTFPEISKSEMESIGLTMPCLEEQTKIANFISAIDSKIEQVAQQLEAAKQFKKGLLQQMFV